MKQRLQLLLAHDINLFAYHLPLDAHPQWGNNAQLGQMLGWTSVAQFGEQLLGCVANADYPHAQAVAEPCGRRAGQADHAGDLGR